MVARRDTGVTRHAGGWIVLAAGLLLVCLRPALSRVVAPPRQGVSAPSPGDSQPRSIAGEPFPALSIDINEASEAELSCIAGVGPTLAGRIVEARRCAGRFTSFDELEQIPGVGPQLAAQLKAALRPLESETAASTLVGQHLLQPPLNLKIELNEPLHD